MPNRADAAISWECFIAWLCVIMWCERDELDGADEVAELPHAATDSAKAAANALAASTLVDLAGIVSPDHELAADGLLRQLFGAGVVVHWPDGQDIRSAVPNT